MHAVDSLRQSRAGLELQGKQLLPTNHPSLLETGFSPPPPSSLPAFSPPHLLPLSLSDCRPHVWASCCWSFFASAVVSLLRSERVRHVFVAQPVGKQCETEQHVLVIPPHCQQVLASCDCQPACPDNAPMKKEEEEEEEEECVKFHQQQLCQLAVAVQLRSPLSGCLVEQGCLSSSSSRAPLDEWMNPAFCWRWFVPWQQLHGYSPINNITVLVCVPAFQAGMQKQSSTLFFFYFHPTKNS